jgi:hypothetical protein
MLFIREAIEAGKTDDMLIRPAPATVRLIDSNKALVITSVNSNSMAIVADAKP